MKPSPTPIESPEEVFRIAFGYMASKALFAGVQLGVFDALDDAPKTLAELVQKTGAQERGLTTLLTALVAVGLLEKSTGDEATYSNAPGTRAMLVSRPEGSFADYCRDQVDRQMYPYLHHLSDVLRGRHDTVPFADYETWFGDRNEATLYSRSQHSASLPAAGLLGAMVDLSACRRLLDVGGGSGAFSITLCQQYPELSATIVDFPNVATVGRRFVRQAGLDERVAFVEGNALDVDWPGDQDVVLFSYVSGSVSAEGVAELYARAQRALQPGGRVLIHDFLVDDDRDGPLLPALWALQHCAFTPGGVSLTPAFVTRLLEESGFEDVRVGSFIPGMTRLVQARRRA